MDHIFVKNRRLDLPIFMPDATRGVIKALDSQDLLKAGIEGVVTNTFHLSSDPGASVLKNFGGLKRFMGWPGFIISDSGGFQLLSLVYSGSSRATIQEQGIKFYRKGTSGKSKVLFTPEKSIALQFAIGADIMICLDDCPKFACSQQENRDSVERTLSWARRSRQEFDRLCQQFELDEDSRPKLFGVIQGDQSPELRKYCFEGLKDIGFDGYGFGGWPLLKDKSLNHHMLGLVADLIPQEFPKYALGVGSPDGIVACYKLGYRIFDCVLPTRDGRHARLYNLIPGLSSANILVQETVFEHFHIKREKYRRDDRPIDDNCDCRTCQNYTRGYLQHLFAIEDSLAGRLATIHNLRTYTRLTKLLRHAK